MTSWRGVRRVCTDPERVGLVALVAAFGTCVWGLTSSLGVEVSPVLGWLAGVVCTGVPLAWLARRVLDQVATERERRRSFGRGEALGLPDHRRGDSDGRSNAEPYAGRGETGRDQQQNGAPGRTW